MKNIILILCFALVPVFVYAENPVKQSDTRKESKQDELVKFVENYLNKLNTLEASFVQTDSLNKSTKGYIFLDRKKKKLKMDSSEHLIIIKDEQISDFNKELEDCTKSTYYSSPLAFLLDKKIDFSKVIVLHQTQFENTFSIRFAKADADVEGQVELHFENGNLTGWTFYNNDDDMYGTTITLFDIKINKGIDESSFE